MNTIRIMGLMLFLIGVLLLVFEFHAIPDILSGILCGAGLGIALTKKNPFKSKQIN